MAEFVEELVDDLVTQAAATAKGTDIFFNELPEDKDLQPATMIVLKDTGGTPSPNTSENARSVQVLVRSATSWATARAKALAILDILHGYASLDISTTNYRILSGVALQLPTDIGVDERGRYRVSFNIVFDVVAA